MMELRFYVIACVDLPDATTILTLPRDADSFDDYVVCDANQSENKLNRNSVELTNLQPT